MLSATTARIASRSMVPSTLGVGAPGVTVGRSRSVPPSWFLVWARAPPAASATAAMTRPECIDRVLIGHPTTARGEGSVA